MKAGANYNFRVIHDINYELFDKRYKAVSSYEVELEKIENFNFRIKLKRDNFKIDNRKIELKFEKIAHSYNDALFPVLFDIKNGNFSLSNFKEISQRLASTDLELKSKHEGPGFEYIRNNFLGKVAKDGHCMAEYFYSFGIIRIILFCLEKAESKPDYNFHWKVLSLDSNVFWKGKKTFDSESNILKYEGNNNDSTELFNNIKIAGTAYNYPDKVSDEESLITTTIKLETQYVTSQLDFEFSETEIKISNSYFNYKEIFAINRKY